ncbi:MAG: RIP metalloprotease RseP [Bacteroidetes bacterium]|nr:RIP metalloprotease RseP [Bacteroidota bacterium]
MNALVMTGQLILALSILVVIHELGHFLVAKGFGMRVDKFYLFFDAWKIKLISKKIGDTEYGIGWLPLGGYVKIAGMIDESMDKEAMKKDPQPWEYRSKPAWQRFLVIIAGITFNTILGILIFTGYLFHFEKEYLPNSAVTDGIFVSELGKEIGLQNGDKITLIDGKEFERFKEVTSLKVIFGTDLTIDRDGETKTITVPSNFFKKIIAEGQRDQFITPYLSDLYVYEIVANSNAEKADLQKDDQLIKVNEQDFKNFEEFRTLLAENAGTTIDLEIKRGEVFENLKVEVDTAGTIGFRPLQKYPYDFKAYSLRAAFGYGAKDAIDAVVYNAVALGKIFTGEVKAGESVHGPIGIAVMYGATWDWRRFWFLTGLLSMVLAFVNLLPIPALDGGHAVFLLFEMVTRRAPSDKFLERAQIVGIVILGALMIYVIGNDFWKHILN